jgi:transposase
LDLFRNLIFLIDIILKDLKKLARLMKFEDLTPEQISELNDIYWNRNLSWDDRMKELSNYLGKSERTAQAWISKLGITEKSLSESPQYIKAKERKFNRKKKKFIITWAQNDTPVHEPFVSNLEAYANHIDADIHVIAGRYKNPTSVFTDKDYESWAERIEPYLDAGRHIVHKHMWIMSDVKIQPTAVNPMTGLEGMSGINSCIFGSPKVHLETIPVLEGSLPKIMMSTGACTVNNYTDSKAGKKGEFHHTLGFAIVEIKDREIFFARNVTATEDGNFTDLYFRVEYDPAFKTGNVSKNEKVAAAVLGDLHYGQHDPAVIKKTLDLFKNLHPENVILHDVFDGMSINHHESNDPFIQFQREMEGTNSLKREVDMMLDGLEDFKNYNVVVVRSNHDDFLDRWLKSTDWRKANTLKNSIEYMEYSALLLKGEAPKGVIPYLINRKFPQFKTLGRSDSFVVNGWELGQHGDIGSNGTRGSLIQFRKLNTKIVVGHYHSPGRKDGALAVGTSTKLRVNYNLGPSGWLQSHVLIHSDGKAQHINFIKGEFTTLKPI